MKSSKCGRNSNSFQVDHPAQITQRFLDPTYYLTIVETIQHFERFQGRWFFRRCLRPPKSYVAEAPDLD